MNDPSYDLKHKCFHAGLMNKLNSGGSDGSKRSSAMAAASAAPADQVNWIASHGSSALT